MTMAASENPARLKERLTGEKLVAGQLERMIVMQIYQDQKLHRFVNLLMSAFVAEGGPLEPATGHPLGMQPVHELTTIVRLSTSSGTAAYCC